MIIFKQVFNSSFRGPQRVTSPRSHRFTLETLEPRIAFDASGLEGPRPDCEYPISTVDPAPFVRPASEDYAAFGGWGNFQLRRTQNFIITHIPEGVTVEKWDNVSNQWCNVSAAPSTSNPRELHRALSLRNIQPDDKYRVTGTPDKGSSVDPFQAVWADGSKVDYYVLFGVLGNSVPNGGCGTMPPSPNPYPSLVPLGPRPIEPTLPLPSNPLDTNNFIGEDSAESKNDLESIRVIDANLTNTDRAFSELNQTNLVGTNSDNTEFTEVDSNPATQTSTELTKTEQAFVDLSLMNLVSTDLIEPDDLTNYNFANILPNALDPAASVLASISD
jgi:hypothetical protein